MAAEQQIRSFVKRLLSSGSLHGGKHSPRRKARDHSNCNCSELAESTPLSSCPEHPSRGQFRNLGGPEYSRLSADALKELETDVEQGVGHEIASRNFRVTSGHPPAATSTSDSSQTATSCVSIPSKNMDITRSPSQGFSTGIIPLTASAPAAVFLPGSPSHVPLPRIKTCGSPASSAAVSNGKPRCHYSHFRRKPAFANGSERRTVVAKASGRVAEAERDSPQVAKDKETLERLAASEEAGPSGRDSEAEEETEAGADFITVTTFNILAPIYKRVSVEGDRESADEARWKKRNEDIVKLLLAKGSSIICLQEFWHKNEELCELYRSRLGAAGYTMFQMGRTNDKGDGLFTAISSNHLRVLDMREIVFHDCGDRVAQLFHLQATELLRKCSIDDHEARPFDWCGSDHAAELILVNTHLMFPHNGNACVIRLRQVYKLVDYLGRYQRERNLPPMPIILCGDWNGSKHGQVYKFLRSRGCISTYDAVHHYDDSDSSRWVSHQNHRGNLAGVDFIYLLNPSNQCEKLEADWKYGAFAMIRSKLREAGLHDRDAFQFFLKDGTHDDHITMQEFYSALDDLGLTGNEDNYGLTPEEIEEIARGLDRDGDGVISFEEASARVNEIEAVMEASMTIDGDTSLMMEINSPRGPPEETTLPPEGLEFVVRDASFERSDFEQGKWPSDYTLSDHAPLTAIFEPVMRVS